MVSEARIVGEYGLAPEPNEAPRVITPQSTNPIDLRLNELEVAMDQMLTERADLLVKDLDTMISMATTIAKRGGPENEDKVALGKLAEQKTRLTSFKSTINMIAATLSQQD